MARLAGFKRAISGQPRRQTANRRRSACPPHYGTWLWPAYLMQHGPFLARLVFSNEKPMLYYVLNDLVIQLFSFWVSQALFVFNVRLSRGIPIKASLPVCVMTS